MIYCVINYYWSIFSLFVAILYCLNNLSIFELEHVNAAVPLAKFAFITVRKRSCRKVMFLHLSVSHCVHRREVSASVLGYTLADTPLGRQPPPQQMATAADGTHPTGMLSCWWITFYSLQVFGHIPWHIYVLNFVLPIIDLGLFVVEYLMNNSILKLNVVKSTKDLLVNQVNRAGPKDKMFMKEAWFLKFIHMLQILRGSLARP